MAIIIRTRTHMVTMTTETIIMENTTIGKSTEIVGAPTGIIDMFRQMLAQKTIFTLKKVQCFETYPYEDSSDNNSS